MFQEILSCITQLWHLLCESLSSTTASQSPSSSATDSQTPSSSASTSPPTRWDVFLSFRGQDTRNNFTSYLYDKLVCNGIQTFMDDPELRSGEVISDALIQAIHESKAYVVVFSEDYASSPWCLSELVEIFHCHTTYERLVIPVFYKIDPSVVRHQIGSFKGAFKKHQARFEMEKVNKWRRTLKQVAELSGLHISENTPEADIINEIVDQILRNINSKVLDVAKYPIGLDSRVEVLTELLNSGTAEGFTKIGLYGMGGVGKTTLAKALFNHLLTRGSFKGSCFLANVREVSGTFKGIKSLQHKLINDILQSKNKIEVYNVEEGIMLIKDRICSAKVLVLIDDIDNPRQYESLVGSFASGSVVITTTRDQDILDKIEIEPKFQYRVNELDDADSLALFTRHAFRNAQQKDSLMVLSTDILRHADGLPLALEVFGSYLYNQSEVGWKSYIEKLQRVPNNSIQQKLIISLNAIELDDPVLKKIFLDIACFFIGWDREKVVKIMETYYNFADHKIDILKKRCLIKINYDAYWGKHELVMHDLLRDMGRNVVRNNVLDEPGKYSRLWLPEDIEDVLKNHKGTVAIEGIIPHNFSNQYAPEGNSFTTETFKRMSKLRFLYFKEVNLTGSFEHMFEDLRVLCWDSCPLKCLPSDFYPEKLVILEFPWSNMKTMWDLNMVSHVFGKLKTLNMSNSEYLITTPDFINLPSLETLILMGCTSLEEVHISIGSLGSLVSLDLRGCEKLKNLQDTICNLRALKYLDISNCNSLEAVPIQLGNIKSLTTLKARGLTVSKLPDSIGHLTNLVELDLWDNKKLETLPDTICNLRSLEILNTGIITKIIESSEISHGITALPSGFSQLSNLQSLHLFGCCNLLSIPELPPNLIWIDASFCSSLKRLPNLSNLKHLEELNLLSCYGLTDIQGLQELTALIELNLRDCSGLRYIQGLDGLTSIKTLRLGYIQGLDDSVVACDHLTKRLFQVYSEIGHQIIVDVGSLPQWPQLPGWITESPYWTSNSESTTVYAHLLPNESHWISKSESTTVYAHLLPNESHNFMAIILCFRARPGMYCPAIDYSVKNTTSGFIWSDRLHVLYMTESLMVIVPTLIFSITDDDHRIELTADNINFVGIHLLYNTETKTFD